VCNSACFSCNEQYSTKIGSLKSKTYFAVDNSDKFWQLPLDRVVHLDINGGEPSASKNYRYLLQNIPTNIRSIRINTNCSTVIPEISNLLDRRIHVTVTVSLDGIEDVHDYVRWPIKWDKFYKNLMAYNSLGIQELNTWTTVSALNIGDFDNILKFVKDHNLNHSYALLHDPSVLNVKYTNSKTVPFKDTLPGQIAVDADNQLELDEFITRQNALRGIL
jgi:sulfatase maturation enzyme AslB (radical SAM superfamily)